MSTASESSEPSVPAPAHRQQAVQPYVLVPLGGDHLSAVAIWRLVVRWSWAVVLAGFLGGVYGAANAVTKEPVYLAGTTIVPASESGGQIQAGPNILGVASAIGLNLGAANSGVDRKIAILTSRAFLVEVIEENDLFDELLGSSWLGTRRTQAEVQEQRDAAPRGLLARTSRWFKGLVWSVLDVPESSLARSPARVPADPDLTTAYEVFAGAVSLQKRPNSELWNLSVEWRDAVQAADWANMLVEMANRKLKTDEIREANRNVDYLSDQLNETSDRQMQQVLYHLAESETQRIMLANGRQDFAFVQIDPAVPPVRPFKPNKIRILLSGIIGGLVISLFIIAAWEFFASLRRSVRAQNRSEVSS